MANAAVSPLLPGAGPSSSSSPPPSRHRRRLYRRSSSRRSCSGSRPTNRRASSAPPSSASHGAASSPAPASAAGSGSSTVGPQCWDSSATPAMLAPAFCPPRADRFDWEALDARHGRVLARMCCRYVPVEDEAFVVWDPITDKEWELPFPPRLALGWAAAVVCARTATGACDHLDCHAEPFLVVFVGLHPSKLFVYTYSSDVNAWREPVSTEYPYQDNYDDFDVENHPVLVENALYFGIRFTNLNPKYNLETCEMSFIQLPSTYEWSYGHRRCYMLTTTKEGVLGLITEDYSKLIHKLCIWLMEDAPEVDSRWTQSRVIDLKTVLPHDGIFTSPNVVCVTDGLGTVFMMAQSAFYTVDLKTCMVELYQYQDIGINCIFPYMSFYAPELEAACAGEGPSEGGSSA